MPEAEFIYVGDPMCSWCWGFAPALDQIGAHYDIPIATVVGGLRPGPSAQPLDDNMRTYLQREWARIADTTSQPFDTSTLDREGWIYDTELPAIALTTMREHAPHDTLRFFERLQRAFYAEAIDVTDSQVYPNLVEDFAVEPETFTAELGTEEAKKRAWADFSIAQQLGAQGFPTLLLRIDDEMAIVTRGYVPFDALEPPLSAWIKEHAEA